MSDGESLSLYNNDKKIFGGGREIKIMISSGTILNLASIDCNFDF